jgi:NADH:ubiquinone oxidoreductase subunit 5 (subunit L)/multisubunit Na+/H+ antiporter MnhA subunit
MGVIFLGIGLSLIFFGSDQPKLGALAFIASLYHALNHACFKGLLFLGAGSIRHSAHSNDLNRLGGLIRSMPWTALTFLIGGLSLSSLPPFNGFVSEWLLLQAGLQATVLHNGVLRAAIPVTFAVLVLTTTLSAACMVKSFGLAFLGQPRGHHLQQVHEVPLGMRTGQLALATLCLGLGVVPTLMVQLLEQTSAQLLGLTLPSATRHGWLWLTPINPERASYSAPLVFATIFTAILVWLAVYLLLRKKRSQKPVQRVPAWDCGFGPLTSRMQYSAESFSMPVQRIFQPLYLQDDSGTVSQTSEPGSARAAPLKKYAPQIHDKLEQRVYQPLGKHLIELARKAGALQTGHLHHYLMYSFLTLIVLLWLIQ